MKVRAVEKGFHDHQLRVPGEVFELRDHEVKGADGKKVKVKAADQFSHAWMEMADGSEPPAVPKPGANFSPSGTEDPNRVLNPNISDNQKSMTDVVMQHGGEQDPKKVKAAKA